MITTRWSASSARAIATICWSPSRRSPDRPPASAGDPYRASAPVPSDASGRIEQAERAPLLPPQEDVRATDSGDQVQLLVDDPDAGVLGVERPVKVTCSPAVERSRPLSGDRPGQDLHQRALAGAVLAAEGVDLAGAQLEQHVGPAPPLRRTASRRPWTSRTAGLGEVVVIRGSSSADSGRNRVPARMTQEEGAFWRTG